MLLFGGTASGMALAYTAIWASQTFGLGPQAVAYLFVVSGFAGAIGNPLIGLASDRLGRRRPFVVGQLIVCACALLGYTQAQSYGLALFLVAFSGFGVMGLTLTTVTDVARTRTDIDGARSLRILSTQRTAWAMGIIVGPAAAAAIVTFAADVRPVFAAGAAMQLIAATLAWSVQEPTDRGANTTVAAMRVPWPRRRLLALTAMVAGLILLALPSQARNMYLPLFITGVLGEPAGSVGLAFTLNACTAVLAMPHMGALANRFGAQRVLYLGVLFGFAYCVLLSLAQSYFVALVVQMLIGLQISLWSTAGLIYLQQLLPDRNGIAGGLYLAVQQLTPVVSGLVLGPIAESRGIPSAFAATAGLLIVSACILVPAHRALTASPLSRWERAGVRA